MFKNPQQHTNPQQNVTPSQQRPAFAQGQQANLPQTKLTLNVDKVAIALFREGKTLMIQSPQAKL